MIKSYQKQLNNHDLKKLIPHVIGRPRASAVCQQLDTTFVNFGNLPFSSSKKTRRKLPFPSVQKPTDSQFEPTCHFLVWRHLPFLVYRNLPISSLQNISCSQFEETYQFLVCTNLIIHGLWEPALLSLKIRATSHVEEICHWLACCAHTGILGTMRMIILKTNATLSNW